MSRSTNPNDFFQTSHSLAETNRKRLKSKNTNGSPIHLKSKILAIIKDTADEKVVYVAGSVGTAQRISLDNPGKTTHTYRGPTTPLTSLTLSTPHADTLFAGCWDKTIWSWSTTTSTPGRRYIGHTDFVTALLYLHLNNTPVLISGSSDTTIIIWSTSTGQKLHTLKGHTRGISSLAVDPSTPYSTPDTSPENIPIILFSAGSDLKICRWALQPDLSKVSEINPENPIIQHESNIYGLHFETDGDDLWTASADGTAKCLSRAQNFQSDTTLPHGDYVRAVAVDGSEKWVITAGRDENVKIWDRASGGLYHTYEGHFEEVTGLVIVGLVVVSVGIDATLRQWSLEGRELEMAVMEAGEARKGVVKEDEGDGKVKEGGMTEEESRELEDLMDDSD